MIFTNKNASKYAYKTVFTKHVKIAMYLSILTFYPSLRISPSPKNLTLPIYAKAPISFYNFI